MPISVASFWNSNEQTSSAFYANLVKHPDAEASLTMSNLVIRSDQCWGVKCEFVEGLVSLEGVSRPQQAYPAATYLWDQKQHWQHWEERREIFVPLKQWHWSFQSDRHRQSNALHPCSPRLWNILPWHASEGRWVQALSESPSISLHKHRDALSLRLEIKLTFFSKF